ncbi:MAG: hypothetical protein AUK47_09015 [Deltaproteobacteria bacterium CG2_30_63_29]|nr:MAG: hypothetical protein AUK47_09015 [Deltaproteobacteria bacterium CG2_30_63_29]PJB42322.1 MAG: hypothetical protein CO108_11935 [Deltaproteobacteria bacterium CG_4_9_14_3_um_filter_63_12]
MSTSEGQLVVMGATLQGFAQACVNLNIIAGRETSGALTEIDIMSFVPFERLREIERIVLMVYEDSGPILERVGFEMMMGWYRFGPGKHIVKTGADFLRFQTGSQGYASVVKGPESKVGIFRLQELDEKKGTALIHSTTPFEKNLERGVIIGGMTAPGDLDYVEVVNTQDPQWFNIEFH